MSFEQVIEGSQAVEKLPELVAGDKVFIPRTGGGMSVAEVALFGVRGAGTVRVTWNENGVPLMRDYLIAELQKVTSESVLLQFEPGTYVEIPRSNGSKSVIQITDRSISADGKLFVTWQENGIDKSAPYDVSVIKKVTAAEFLQTAPAAPAVSDVPTVTAETSEVTVSENPEDSDQEYFHQWVKNFFIEHGMNPAEAERRTTALIDAAFIELAAYPEKLPDRIADIVNNIRKEYAMIEAVAAPDSDTQPLPDVEMLAPTEVQEEVLTQPSFEELHAQADAVLVLIDSLMKTTAVVKGTPLQFFKSRILNLDRRYKQYSEPNSIEKDPGIRAMMLARTRSEMAKVISEAEMMVQEAAVAAVNEKNVSAESEALSPTIPVVLSEPVVPVVSEVPASPSGTEGIQKWESLNQKLAAYTSVKNTYLTKLRDVQTLRQTPARDIMDRRDFELIVSNLETDLVAQKALYEAALDQIQFEFGAVYQDEVLQAETALEVGTSFASRVQNIKAALVRAFKQNTPTEPDTSIWSSALRPRPVPTKRVEVVEGVELSEPAVLETSSGSPYSGMAQEPVDPGVLLHVPAETPEEVPTIPVVASPKVFTIETPVRPVVPESSDRWSVSEHLAVVEPVSTKSPESESQITPDMVADFLKNFEGGSLARSDAFENWVEGIEGKHPGRFARTLNAWRGVEHKNAFAVLEPMYMRDIRAIIRMPEIARISRLHELKIEPDEFEKWRRFLTAASMIPEIKIHNADSETFGHFAEYVFAHDALRARN